MSEGWIKLHRKLTDNPLWKCEKFTRGQAWVDLILLANHEYGYFYLRNHKIEVQRGQVGYSQLKLAERWKWSRSKVKKFLNDMEKEQQVVQQQSKSISLITIVNYEIHQQKEQQVVQQQSNSRATAEQQHDTNKKNKNDKNVKNIIKQVFTFYSNQIKKIEDNESLKNNYINLVGYLFGDNAIGCPVEHILKLKNQLNFDEYKKIFKAAYSKNLSVSELFDSWVNNPKYSKGKVSIYLTLNNWINRAEGKTLKSNPEKKWDNTPKTGETLSLLEVINKMKR